MRSKLSQILISAALVMFTLHPAASQTFEDRWSIVPKANAAPSLKVDEQPESGAEPPANARAEEAPARSTFTGKASYYSYQGGRTASGEEFDPNALTAAHRTLPFGTKVRVTDPTNGNSVTVVITDRGPRKPDRVIDLSLGAARELGITDRGVARIEAEVF
jgi:rare lipoprotein A